MVNAKEDDLILISDVDEIPNLENIDLNSFNEKVIVFNQRFFCYKLNFGTKKPIWHGTRGCKKKFLKSPQWLRNLKFKKRSFWRLDKFRLNNIIENGCSLSQDSVFSLFVLFAQPMYL